MYTITGVNVDKMCNNVMMGLLVYPCVVYLVILA